MRAAHESSTARRNMRAAHKQYNKARHEGTTATAAHREAVVADLAAVHAQQAPAGPQGLDERQDVPHPAVTGLPFQPPCPAQLALRDTWLCRTMRMRTCVDDRGARPCCRSGGQLLVDLEPVVSWGLRRSEYFEERSSEEVSGNSEVVSVIYEDSHR